MCAEYEYINFGDWIRWSTRDRPSREVDDVPEIFGVQGVYLIGEFRSPPIQRSIEPKCLPQEIIYIGMSKHLDRRLEKSHQAVKKYRRETGDVHCDSLWYCRAYSHWSNISENKAVTAYVLYYERALILEYVRAYGNLPKYNKC